MTSSTQSLILIHQSNNSLIYYQSDGEYHRPVVIKVLNSKFPTPKQLIHFNNEYEITKDLAATSVRKAIVQTRMADKPALVLEYIAGETLKQAYVDRKQPLVNLLQVAIRIAQALGELHECHLIHRDINSRNILVERESRQIKIIDLSLASRLEVQVQHLGNPEGLAGTLGYISPEATGRTNRIVDCRTDLYSLGATFYEMFTGQLPFEGDDPLALVHAHLAKAPQPITVLNPNIPPILSDIVLKLLAKNPEERYQSAFGLKADLERCLATLTDLQDFDTFDSLLFELGQDDYVSQFHLPQKLYGRSTEIATLLATFKRVASGSQELMLVAGYPGVGKSALVAEIHQPITAKRGYFISGKFDQYQQHTPYAAFSQAFNQLADLLLTERETILQQWRDKILAAVGSNGAVLTEIIPHLEQIIGSQPAVTSLAGPENRNRFYLTFQNFVQAISTAEHPLVIFIDDWQWADLASLELLKVLLTNQTNTHLLVLGAYRDNEVDRTHPFITTIADLTNAGVTVQTIELGTLPVKDVQQLIHEGLACYTADSQALAELVYDKTQGNAFFTRQFLQNLYDEGWLQFNFDNHRWVWDIAQLKAQNITSNVVDLMTAKLKKLPGQTAQLLQLAACIGDKFDLRTLALLGQINERTALVRLEEALTQGLVIPLDDYYKLPDMAAQARFMFLHDRVQQAAYSQIPAKEQQTVHLEIGRLLLANTPETDLEQRAFEIVQHYNQVDPSVLDESERLRLAELNMLAAGLAGRSAAFRSAQTYLDAALALMPADAWTSHYTWMLKLHSQLATALSLTGNFERLEHIFQITTAQAHTVADTAGVKLAKIQGLLSCGNYPEAIDFGLTFIEALGVPINRNPSPEEAFNYLQETAEWLTPARIERLHHLPAASTEVELILETAVTINGPIFGSNMPLCFVFVSQMTRLCIGQGLAAWAPVTLTTFALLLSAALHDIARARLLTDVTMQLYEEKYPVDSLVPYLSVPVGGFIMHRYTHLKHTLPIFANGVQQGLMTGAFLFDGYCAWWHAWHHLFLGVPLARVETVSQQAVETCQKIHMERLRDWCLLVKQATLNLQGKNETAWILTGEAYDEQKMLALALQINDFAEAFRVFFYKAWLHYLFGQPLAAVKLFQEAEAYLIYGVGLYLVPLFYFYDTLANTAIYNDQNLEEQPQILERVKRNLAQLEVWVHYAPMNHQHKQDLMAAEQARLEGRYWEAVTSYDKAMQGARENEFLNEEALACELYGKFWLERGHLELANIYLQKAQNLYGLWGAVAKVEQLQTRFGSVINPTPTQNMQDTSKLTSLSSETSTSSWLDINTVLKANQTLSQTVQLVDLLVEMINILLENAGAERALILYRQEEAWFIEAEGRVQDQDIQTGLHLPLSEASTLSLSIFNYIIHSGKAIVLANASEDPQFGIETYLREHEIKSVLCLPVWHKGELKLVLYLENNLTLGAFTENRLDLLQMLSAQMAISLENALMVDHLRTSISRRIQSERALQASEEKIRALMEISPDIIMTLDRAGIILFINRVMPGYRLEDVVGADCFMHLAPENHERYRQALKRAFQSRDSDYFEHLDSGIWWESRFIPIRDNDEEVTAAMVIATDITERKRAEEALRENEKKYRNVIENIQDVFYRSDVSGHLLMSSPSGAKMFGYNSIDEMIGLPLDSLWPDPKERQQLLAQVKATGSVTDYEAQLRRKDGTTFYASFTTHFYYDDCGNLLGTEGIIRDITERKRTEIALRGSEERFQLFMHYFPGLAYIKDSTTRTLFANQGFQTYLDIGPEELLGKANHDIFPPEFAEQITADDKHVFESGQSREIEERFGDRIWSTYKFILPQPDHSPLLGGFTLDITERKRAEAQVEYNLRETRVRLEISQALAGAETEDEVLNALIQHAGLYPQVHVSILTFDQTEGDLEVILQRDHAFESGFVNAIPVGTRFSAVSFPMLNLFSADQPFVLNDIWTDERIDPTSRELFRSGEANSHAAFPLTVGNEWMGYIGVTAKSAGFFDKEKQHLYQTLAEQGAGALRAARLRETIRASQQRLSLLVQHSPLAVIEWDTDFRVVSWNPAAEQIFGYTSTEAIGCHATDLIVPQTVWPLVDDVWQALLAQEGGTYITNDNITKAGQLITCEWFNAPLAGADGQVMGVASLVQDITKRKQIEADLRTSEARYRALVESQIDLISRYLPDTTLTFVNDAYCQFYGKTREELIGLSYLTMVAPEFHEQALKETENFVKDPRLISGEYLNYRWDGKECWIHWILQGIVDDNGRVVEVQASGRDITPLKQAEEEIRRLNEELEQRVIERTAQLEAANKELEAFSYSVSHDLRAPLRHIDGFLEILEKRIAASLDERSQHYMNTISDSAKRMGQLIDDLLSFSRMGRNEMSHRLVDLDTLVQEIVHQLEPETQGRTVHWHITNLPIVTGDQAMLRLVLVNLLSNALKFTRGCPQAEIEVGQLPSQNGEMVIFIRDNGVGFDMAYADKLFGVFQRLHRADEFEGTGIGLANVRRIIQRHGGRTWAEGAVNRGATFYFSLPQSIQET